MNARTGDRARRLERLVGVYDADHTLRGELAYWIGARLGRTHCALCAITHGAVRERRDWAACRAGLPVPFDTFHRDDQPDDVASAIPALPAVVARTDDGDVTPLLGPEELEACDGDPASLADAVAAAVRAGGLEWPPAE